MPWFVRSQQSGGSAVLPEIQLSVNRLGKGAPGNLRVGELGWGGEKAPVLVFRGPLAALATSSREQQEPSHCGTRATCQVWPGRGGDGPSAP